MLEKKLKQPARPTCRACDRRGVALGCGGVLDQGQAALVAEPLQRLHAAAIAAVVHGADRLGARGDAPLDVVGVERQVVLARARPPAPASRRSSGPRPRVATKVIAGTITSSPGPTPAARYARCSAAVQLDERDRVLDAEVLGEGLLELLRFAGPSSASPSAACPRLRSIVAIAQAERRRAGSGGWLGHWR